MRRLGQTAVVAVLALMLAAPAGVVADSTTTTPVPILLFHNVATAPRHSARASIFVAPSLFKRQISALADAGYTAVTLDDVWNAWHGAGALPDKPVVLDFDDGYANQYAVALPTLRAHGWPGVLSLIVHNPYPDPISPAQVRRMLDAGWELDAHTLTHPDLTKISHARVVREVAQSRKLLKARYHQPVNFLAYPYGHTDSQVVAAVKSAGFLGATTTTSGIATPDGDPDRLPRIIVSPHTTPTALVSKLERDVLQ